MEEFLEQKYSLRKVSHLDNINSFQETDANSTFAVYSYSNEESLKDLSLVATDKIEQDLYKAIAKIPPYKRGELACKFLGRLRQVDAAKLNQLSFATTQPETMQISEVSQLAAYTYRTHPEIFQEIIAEQPDLVGTLSNPLIAAIVGIMAAKWLHHDSE